MVYKKITFISIALAIVATIVSSFVFGSSQVTSNDQIIDSTMQILIFIQKYSWPIVTLIFIYALYQFYVIGSEVLEHKILGQRLIVGVAIFMVLIQCLPLMYAFLIVK
ncbi:MAG: hypothetical protein RSE00_00290 [Clostridia bacterium]